MPWKRGREKKKKDLLDKVEDEVVYGFHKYKKQLVAIDHILVIGAFLLLGVFRPDLVVLVAYVFAFPYIFFSKRHKFFPYLVISSIVAIIWVFINRFNYAYNQDFYVVFGLNLFPLAAWAIGLFASFMIYSHFEHKIKKQHFLIKLLWFSVPFFIALALAETIGYNVFGIKDLAVAGYSALPICNCLHGPWWMKVAYFAMGPIYFTICKLFRLKNPHSWRV